MRNSRRHPRIRPQLDSLDDRCLLSGYSPIAPSGYTPAEITAAYGLSALTFASPSGSTVKADGSGETIALVEAYHDPTLAADLNTFDQASSLPAANLTVVNQASTQTNSGWAGEESLDVEWAHAIAPGANILVVEAKSQSLQDLLNAVNTARNMAGVNVVSMSWGFSEMSNEASYDSYFTTPAGHVGITFIAASGDSGTVEYPSASPNVLSVGGTTLTLSSSGTYQSESAWYDSGGGYSQDEAEPSYQKPVQTSGFRSTPDVAFAANPNTGVEVYETPVGFNQGFPGFSASANQGSWQVVGGTSLGAPSWAGIIAIVDQGRALAGKGSLDGPTETLPALYAAPSADFNAVTASTSSNPGSGSQPGWGGFDPFGGFESYSFSYWNQSGNNLPGSGTLSGATANTSTGLGSPLGASLVNDLVASTLTTPLTTISGSGQSSGGSGTTPTPPTGGGSKHHHPTKHAKTVKHTVTHTPTVSRHRVVTQKSTTKKADVHRRSES